MLYTIYKLEEWHDMLYDNGTMSCACNLTDNRPMNERVVKLHKGVDNEVKFRVFDSDRRRTDIRHVRVRITLVNQENRELSHTVEATQMPERGTFKVTYHEGNLVNLSPGYYDMVVTAEEWAVPEQPGEIVSTPFYSDTAANMNLTALITTQGEKLPVPTIEVHSINPKTGISDWISTNEIVDTVYTRIYHSSPIAANRLKNQKSGTHTFAITCDKFRGRIAAHGSLEHSPPSEVHQYFPLDLAGSLSKDYVDVGIYDPLTGLRAPFTGVEPWTFSANCMWIMFSFIPTDEKGVPLDENSLLLDGTTFIEPITRLQVRS